MIQQTTLLELLYFLTMLVGHTRSLGRFEVTMWEYENRAVCNLDVFSSACNFKFTWEYRAEGTAMTYGKKFETILNADKSGLIQFGIGKDALGYGHPNPTKQWTFLKTRSGERRVELDIRVAIPLSGSDLPVTSFKIVLPTNISQPNVLHNGTYPDQTGGHLKYAFQLYCNANFRGPGCGACIEEHYTKHCNKTCKDYGNFTCDQDTGEKICKDYYYTDNCTVYCKATSDYTCDGNGTKACIGHRQGRECDTCATNYYTDTCDTFCEGNDNYTCNASTGDKICKEHRDGVNCTSCAADWHGTHCLKPSKSGLRRLLHMTVGVLGTGCIFLVVLLILIIFRRITQRQTTDVAQLCSERQAIYENNLPYMSL